MPSIVMGTGSTMASTRLRKYSTPGFSRLLTRGTGYDMLTLLTWSAKCSAQCTLVETASQVMLHHTADSGAAVAHAPGDTGDMTKGVASLNQ